MASTEPRVAALRSVHVAGMHDVGCLTPSAALDGAAASVRVNAVASGPVATEVPCRIASGDETAEAGFLAWNPAWHAATAEANARTTGDGFAAA